MLALNSRKQRMTDSVLGLKIAFLIGGEWFCFFFHNHFKATASLRKCMPSVGVRRWSGVRGQRKLPGMRVTPGPVLAGCSRSPLWTLKMSHQRSWPVTKLCDAARLDAQCDRAGKEPCGKREAVFLPRGCA